jgi:hypothetical protein
LVDSKDVDTLSTELENRLDDLFGENNLSPAEAKDNDGAAHYPLAELKNLILSIDWEITDDVLEKFLQQIKDLKLTYKHDKIVLTFLQILNSLGDYIETNRAKSHPKTFKILNSVFSNLDKVVLSKDMPEAAKKKILRIEMTRYKKLRAQISQSKSDAQSKPKAKPDTAAEPEVATEAQDEPLTLTEPSVQPAEAVLSEETLIEPAHQPETVSLRTPSVETLADAVAEIKKYLHDEISALRKEIEALRNQ